MYLKLMLNFIILIMANYAMAQSLNVFGQPLLLCCNEPKTGFYRDGFCNTGSNDVGTHVICAEMTAEFLSFTKSKGNDLSTPNPFYDFPGLKPGDYWCLCAIRWKEAYDADAAPKVKLESTHEKALDFVTIKQLIEHAVK